MIPGLGRSGRDGIGYSLQNSWASLVAQLVKNLPTMRETWVPSLGWEDSLKKGKATHSSILAWRIPLAVKSMGLQKVRHNWATFTFINSRCKVRLFFLVPKVGLYFYKLSLRTAFAASHRSRKLCFQFQSPQAIFQFSLWFLHWLTVCFCLFVCFLSSMMFTFHLFVFFFNYFLASYPCDHKKNVWYDYSLLKFIETCFVV